MTVYANGKEIASKSSSNKSVAAMPDVCMSPPAPPAGPIPVPYPNTSMASDLTDGSKTVQIGGEEVALKNTSSYKKSTGNEPATSNFGANLVTHQIQGPTHFTAWSMDVQVEGANVARFMDLTSHNDSNPPGGGLIVSGGKPGVSPTGEDCTELKAQNENERTLMAKSGNQAVQDLVSPSAGGVVHPNAIASAAFSPTGGGLSRFFGASSRSVLERGGSNGGGAGNSSTNSQSKVCPDKPFNYTEFRHQFHAESKIFEAIGKTMESGGPATGTVLFGIDWLNRSGKPPTSPCDHCKAMMEHACECLNISVCNPKGQPENKCPEEEDAP